MGENRQDPTFMYLLVVMCIAAFIFGMWFFTHNIRWTSVEKGCVVERRFESGWSWRDSVIVEKVCPLPDSGSSVEQT